MSDLVNRFLKVKFVLTRRGVLTKTVVNNIMNIEALFSLCLYIPDTGNRGVPLCIRKGV